MSERTARNIASDVSYGPDDEVGALNEITEQSVLGILSRISSGKVYDLSVDFFIGMPSFTVFGDPHFQMWMKKTPRGVLNDKNPLLMQNNPERVTWSGDALSMYTHTGTHIDAYNHFCLGLDCHTYNGFKADEHLGDQGWKVAGVNKMPPIITRGVMLDVAAFKQVTMLDPSYGISAEDLEGTAQQQNVKVQKGDAVLLRTGRMTVWPDVEKYTYNEPGLKLDGARWLVEDKGAILVGADNLSMEQWPSSDPNNPTPIHSYLLVKCGVPIIEVLWLEELAKDQVYEFAFIATPLKIRGATGAPLRPIAIPVR